MRSILKLAVMLRLVRCESGPAAGSSIHPHGRGGLDCAVRRHIATAGAVVALLASGQPLEASPIIYGDFVGAHVTFLNVTEETSGAPALFGPPAVSVDSMSFHPLNFAAASAGGGTESTSGNLTFSVFVAPGNRLDQLTLTQSGNTTLAGNAALGSITTGSQVAAGGTFEIEEVDFVPISTISIPFSLAFSPSGGSFFLGTDGGGGPLFNSPFDGTALIGIEDILVALNVPFALGATKVSIDWTPTLQAQSLPGTSSLITGLVLDASISTFRVRETPVSAPEPASLALIGLGLACLARRTKHRRGR